jgi:SsrA-binding protein
MMGLMATKTGKKKGSASIQVKNKKAYHDYKLLEKVEAGLSLLGTEVKSLRDGGGDLEGSYARITDDECWLIGCKIAPYAPKAAAAQKADRKNKGQTHPAGLYSRAA